MVVSMKEKEKKVIGASSAARRRVDVGVSAGDGMDMEECHDREQRGKSKETKRA